MDESYQIIAMLIGMVGLSLVAEILRAFVWCGMGWVFFRNWFKR